MREFWKAALFTLPDNHILHEMHEVPVWVKLAPFVADGARLRCRLASSTSARRSCRGSSPRSHRGALPLPAQQVVFRRALRLPVRAAGQARSAASCGRAATAVIDGLGPDGISARVVDVTNRVVKLQTGYLYHYAFAMLIGVAALVTWMMFGERI